MHVHLAVPVPTYDDFSTAFSKGSFFNQHIRDAYEFREVTPR